MPARKSSAVITPTPFSALRKAFFPVFRISRAAIAKVDQGHRAGWLGHFEVLVPTLLAREGLAVQDLRATHPCYVGASQNPSPILPLQASLRWRPKVSRAEFSQRGSGALLFHPVKDNWAFDGEKVVEWPG